MALRADHQGSSWLDWPAPLRNRQPEALEAAQRRLKDAVNQVRTEQFFFEQRRALKDHAAQRDIRLFGDLPIFVALDSADVWANRRDFRLDADGRPEVVAGGNVVVGRAPYLGALLNDWSGTLVLVVGASVGLAAVAGTLRFLYGWSLKALIYASLLPVLGLTVFATFDPELHKTIGLAWDCGAVTTGPPIWMCRAVASSTSRRWRTSLPTSRTA